MSRDKSPRPTSLASLAAELADTPYLPLRVIGQGGMGSLVEVAHKNLRRSFAMKILRDPNRPDLEDRLRVEAHALAQLTHVNVLAVVDFDRTSTGRPYIVAELLRGQTLRDRLELRGKLPVREAVDLARQTLAGLSAAHRLGIVHRDVKLENLFVVETEGELTIKVIDFGIAKILETEPGRALAVEPPMVPTDEGLMMGTPSFMSPEQIQNGDVDHRADIYGVGVVLYRLLTGRHLFLCDTAFEYAEAHTERVPEPPSAWVRLPHGLDGVVMRALEKRPRDRFSSAREMMAALEPFLKDETAPAAPPRAAKLELPSLGDADMTPTTLRSSEPEIDADLTDAVKRADLQKLARPITSRPVFAPVAPPRPSFTRGALPSMVIEEEEEEVDHETVVATKNQRTIHCYSNSHSHSQSDAVVEVAAVEGAPHRAPPIEVEDAPRGSSRPSLRDRNGHLVRVTHEGPTRLSRRPSGEVQRRGDRSTRFASAFIVSILAITVAYVGWLLYTVR